MVDQEKSLSKREGVIFNIQSYSIHDGPGIRTVVFFKGCPLSCVWCSNPEAQNKNPELGVLTDRCQQCRKCISVCPVQAIAIAENGTIMTDKELCITCGKCEMVCPYRARKVYGRKITTERLMEEIIKDAPFYIRSGGGVTLSGGEPTVQYEALIEILQACKAKFIHTAIETCGFIKSRKKLENILKYLDLILYDIKCIDEEKHRRFTGVSNDIILDNARFIASSGKEMIIRVPLIPGFNDNKGEIEKIGKFVLSLVSVKEIHLLPYHEFGKSKYRMLEKKYILNDSAGIPTPRVMEFKSLLESYSTYFHVKL